jgi:hypothetical protein
LKELYANLWGSVGNYIQSWLLPSIIAVGFFSAALFPAVQDEKPWSGIRAMSATERGVVFAFATVILSFLLASTSRPLLRLLEGYTVWPSLQEKWTNAQRKRWNDLSEQISNATTQKALSLREQLNQYPRGSEFILPTRLGNALRAGETYGWIQYGLSTVDLWTRLVAVANKPIVDQLSQSRAVLDVFVALIALSVVLIAATLLIVGWSGQWLYLLWVVPLGGLMPLWYERAVASVAWYSQGMHALADLSRGKLAAALGVRLPGSIAEERTLWNALSDYAAWGPEWGESDAWLATIDAALVPRGAQEQPPPPADHEPQADDEDDQAD